MLVLHLLINTMVQMVYVSLCTVMALLIKVKFLKCTTWPNYGIFLLFLCVRIMATVWVPVLRELLLALTIIHVVITYLEYGLVFPFNLLLYFPVFYIAAVNSGDELFLCIVGLFKFLFSAFFNSLKMSL